MKARDIDRFRVTLFSLAVALGVPPKQEQFSIASSQRAALVLHFLRPRTKQVFAVWCSTGWRKWQGVLRGASPQLGVSNRGEKPLLAWGVQRGTAFPLPGRIQRNQRFRGTRFCLQSLVCYTFCGRRRRKGAVTVPDRPFPETAEERIFASRVCLQIFALRVEALRQSGGQRPGAKPQHRAARGI